VGLWIRKKMKKFCVFIAFMFFVLILSPEPLKIGIHPFEPESEITKNFLPFARFLSEKTGREFIVLVSSSYEDHLSKTGNDFYDISFVGPVGYIDIVNNYGKKRIIAKLCGKGEGKFFGKIIANKNSGYYNLRDIDINEIAFVDQKSTMGFIVPYFLWKQENGNLPVMTRFNFLGDHYNVAVAVLSGDYKAGAVKDEVFQRYCRKQCRVICTTPAIVDHCFLASDKIDEPFFKKMTALMLDMKNSKSGVQILRSIRGDLSGLIYGSDNDYAELRNIYDNVTGDLLH
jgi:phosphonate transport system substrate-binding protein